MYTPPWLLSSVRKKNKFTCPVFHFVKQAGAEITDRGQTLKGGEDKGKRFHRRLSPPEQRRATGHRAAGAAQAFTLKPFCSSADFGVNSLTGFLS